MEDSGESPSGQAEPPVLHPIEAEALDETGQECLMNNRDFVQEQREDQTLSHAWDQIVTPDGEWSGDLGHHRDPTLKSTRDCSSNKRPPTTEDAPAAVSSQDTLAGAMIPRPLGAICQTLREREDASKGSCQVFLARHQQGLCAISVPQALGTS